MRRAVLHWRPRPKPRRVRKAASPRIRFNFVKLFINLILFSILSLALQYAELSRLGQETLDYGYDYLVRANFEKSVLQGGDPAPVSPDLRLVFFEARHYEQSYTKGYWTPRDEVGAAVLNSLKRGAEIILVDFSFTGEAPVVMENGRPHDGARKFLELLTEAAELARTKKAVILVPPASDPPPKGYLELLNRYRDVFRPAGFEIRRDTYDGQVRRLSWFSYNAEYAPVLSAALSAALLSKQKEDAAAALREAKAFLVGAQDRAQRLPPGLARALKPEAQKAASRIIYRLLPREVVAREFGSGPDLSRSVLWRPPQIAAPGAEPDFTGKIVLIGSDYPENGDVHQTVFGPLAGSYILANGLNMILNERMIEEAKGLNLALLILTGLLASIVFARFSAFIPIALFFGAALVSPWLSAWVFNRYGFFLDVWLPALGVGAYNLIVEYSGWNLFFSRQGLLRQWFRRRRR